MRVPGDYAQFYRQPFPEEREQGNCFYPSAVYFDTRTLRMTNRQLGNERPHLKIDYPNKAVGVVRDCSYKFSKNLEFKLLVGEH